MIEFGDATESFQNRDVVKGATGEIRRKEIF